MTAVPMIVHARSEKVSNKHVSFVNFGDDLKMNYINYRSYMYVHRQKYLKGEFTFFDIVIYFFSSPT